MHFQIASFLLAVVPACLASKLPIVDLGYELHQAISFSQYANAYNFTNIRYAAPPVDDLRFRAPVPPSTNRTQIQNGTEGRVCPQSSTLWQEYITDPFLESYSTGKPFSGSLNISSYPYKPGPIGPEITEDCLFLDVIAPKKTFDSAHSKTIVPKKSLAPVLVWIYGGGYTTGDKSTFDSLGLLKRSQKNGNGIVYVALNYRLGAFGWLAGDSLTANGTANAALHDQRLALKWVYNNIHLFGGDPQRVTVMGESAGGGSIMHQVTAYGGIGGPAPFQQAILQSPGWFPLPAENQQEATLQQFLDILNVSSVEEARQLPSQKLIAANEYQVATKSSYGTYTYGPVVDGTFVPELPGKLLLEGKFDKNLRIMVGHNANEGLLFTPPSSNNTGSYATLLKQDFPGIKQSVLDHVTKDLYPPVYNGTYGYTNPIQRFALTLADVVFQCNTDYFNRAFQKQTFSYMFSVPPGLHGSDIPYTFYDPSANSSSSVANPYVAFALQDYITSFTQTGHPNSTAGPAFEQYGVKSNLQKLGPVNITTVRDSTANARCRFWQTAPYAQ